MHAAISPTGTGAQAVDAWSGHPGQLKVRRGPSGVHLFDRLTGLNILLDAIVVPRREWAQAPRYVSIALTNACDLHCPYCYAPKSPARLERSRVIGWIEELDRGGTLGVGFGGGEPTVHPEFAEICQIASERTQMAITFTTHGHRLTNPLVEKLSRSVHFVRVSVDGVGKTYEELRGRSFDKLRANLELVRAIAPFGLNVVVNARTIGDLDALAEFGLDVGAEEILLLPEQPVGRGQRISPSVMRQLEQWVLRTPRPIRLSVSAAGIGSSMPLAQPHVSESALDEHAHIDAEGTLRPNAFSRRGVPVERSLMQAINQLRLP